MKSPKLQQEEETDHVGRREIPKGRESCRESSQAGKVKGEEAEGSLKICGRH